MVKEASSGGSYRLTQKLFVYQNGKFDEFKEGAEPNSPAQGSKKP
jgi:hypothetical protein